MCYREIQLDKQQATFPTVTQTVWQTKANERQTARLKNRQANRQLQTDGPTVTSITRGKKPEQWVKMQNPKAKIFPVLFILCLISVSCLHVWQIFFLHSMRICPSATTTVFLAGMKLRDIWNKLTVSQSARQMTLSINQTVSWIDGPVNQFIS